MTDEEDAALAKSPQVSMDGGSIVTSDGATVDEGLLKSNPCFLVKYGDKRTLEKANTACDKLNKDSAAKKLKNRFRPTFEYT